VKTDRQGESRSPGALEGPVVHAQALTKRYGEREALSDFHLELPRGTCHGVLGPNGSGKTTFIKLVCGLFRPSAGTLEVCGLPVPKSADRARARLGVLLDQPLVPWHLSLADALAYVSDLHGGQIPQSRSDALLDRVGLTWRRRDPLRTFSRGMAQRASLVCALLPDPELLILDEPFTGLDAQGCGLVETVIAEVVAEGRTVLLVTHELRRAERLCDAVTWLDRGRVVRRTRRGEWTAGEVEGAE
jgi:ABC-type multidrug transport system ATPase subunit